MSATSWVYCTFQVEAFHRWATAEDEHKYLASAHRHMFHFKVGVRVTGDDREIEFIQMKKNLSRKMGVLMQSGQEEPLNSSCEMLASAALRHVIDSYGDRDCYADVSEDGENGAYVTYTKEEK